VPFAGRQVSVQPVSAVIEDEPFNRPTAVGELPLAQASDTFRAIG